jgi:predicted transcriptional regulator
MNISETKIALAKKLLDSDDKELIKNVKAIFETRNADWYEELPEAIQISVSKGLKQSERKETVPHAEVMKSYKKWLKK